MHKIIPIYGRLKVIPGSLYAVKDYSGKNTYEGSEEECRKHLQKIKDIEFKKLYSVVSINLFRGNTDDRKKI